jgi:glycerol-3-phosphate dehydrogenase
MGRVIQRRPSGAAASTFDVLVVGGGIYGVALTLEAARRGLHAVLLERDDFGGATSWNSLRIVHGGLRYLQSLDIPRLRESVRERRWLRQTFPDLVRPLPCLMPLYGNGLKRPSAFRAALMATDLLSRSRGQASRASADLPRGRVLDAAETARLFPAVDRQGLRGAGLWYDAVMPTSQRVLIAMLRWACSLGAVALNYLEATDLLVENEAVVGVTARDRLTGERLDVRARSVVNCAGPWVGALSARWDRSRPELFRPSLAFNVLLDRPPLSETALAVAPRGPGGHVYVLYPWRGRILAGTVHAPWDGGPDGPQPSEPQLNALLADLKGAIPAFEVHRADVVRVFAGLLPARRAGSADLAVREVIVDHARAGRRGLVSVSGVKFTTARLVAEKALAVALACRRDALPAYRTDADRPRERFRLDLDGPEELMAGEESWTYAEVRRLVEEESVIELDDLLLRRTNWGADPRTYHAVREKVARLLGGSPSHPQESSMASVSDVPARAHPRSLT